MALLFVYIALVAYLPLMLVTAKTVSRAKLSDAVFCRTLAKDYLRTLPIVALISLPPVLFPQAACVYLIGLHLVFFLPLVLELGHIHLFGTRVGMNTFYSLFVSNRRETREFIAQNLGIWKLAAVFALYAAIPFALVRLPVTTELTCASRLGLGVALAALAVPFVRNLFKRPEKRKDGYILNPYSNLIVNYFDYRVKYRRLREMIALRVAPPFTDIVSRLPAGESETYVIVIGESANAGHHRYCGYPRETNEFTDRLGPELLRFKGVRSNFAQTIPSLERTLTFADADHPERVGTQGSIIDYFHDAGFKTYWLSNQYALDDTALTALSSHADITKCYNFGGMKRFEKAGLDEGLLPDFIRHLQSEPKKKAIFLHLIGSHAAYVNRYPDEFAHFTGTEKGRTLTELKARVLNAYDDSIRYTDFLIARFIEELKKVGGVSALVYFADHGEDIYDSREDRILGHSELANGPMTAVPLMVYLSPSLRAARSELVAAFRPDAAGYTLQDLIHTIIDIASLTSGDFIPERSVFR